MRLLVIPQGVKSSDEALVHDGRQRHVALHGQRLEPEGDPITIELAEGMSVKIKLLSYEDQVPLRDGSGSHTLAHGQEMECEGKNVVIGTDSSTRVKHNVEVTESVAVESGQATRTRITKKTGGVDE